MKFGAVPVADALGATAVHSIRTGELVLKKGTLIRAEEVAALNAAGVKEIVVSRLEPGDVSEDEAAADIAAALKGEGVRLDRAFTGRCNLFADRAGVLVVDRGAIDGLNRVDEAVTAATLSAFKPVVEGEMIATVKIIPFAVAAAARDKAVAEASRAAPVIRVAPYTIKRVGIVSTLLPGLSPKVIDKTLKITEARIAPAGATIVAEKRVPHEQGALARAITEVRAAGAELVIVFGASAIADRRDVIPMALETAGGEIEHFGMPVDPGNLMLVGRIDGEPVLGAPGCARSPKENGFDWILMRLLAGLPVTRADITGMGVGGLLMEIVTRPQPRTEPKPEKGRRMAAVVLAAGRSTRMGAINKLIAEIGGKPLVRIAAEQALASHASPVIVVTGHEREKVEAALAGLPVKF
ncbi:MAG: NTP transferase domain-containing protein, partial [Pseudolabrys sp.]